MTLSIPEISRARSSRVRRFTGVHSHAEHELYYLVRGETKYFIGDEIFQVSEGDFVLIPRGMLHKTDSEDCLTVERLLVRFEDSMLSEESRRWVEALSESKLLYLPPRSRGEAAALLQTMEADAESGDEFGEPLNRLRLQELLGLLCRYREERPDNPTETVRLIRRISDYIRDHYAEDLTLQELGTRFGISRSYLSLRFRQATGMGLSEYITYVRIHNACELLAQPGRSVTEVASACGFNGSNYFAAVFKKAKGVTPYQYAKQIQREKSL